MVQLHSTPISETLAHICGLVAGLVAYFVSGTLTPDHMMRIKIGVIASVLCNAIVGGKINFLMKDFLAMAIVRPVSAYFGAKLLEYVIKQMNW